MAHAKGRIDQKRGVAKRPELQPWVDLVTNSPSCSGVYIVWSKDRCLYVGSAVIIRQRLIQGRHGERFLPHNPDSVVCMPCDDYRQKELELISHLEPCLNVVRPRKEAQQHEKLKCSVCKKRKISGLFAPSQVRRTGDSHWCIACVSKRNSPYRALVPEGVPRRVFNPTSHISKPSFTGTNYCRYCTNIALYRVGAINYCRDHRQMAVDQRRVISMAYCEPKGAAIEELLNQWDAIDRTRNWFAPHGVPSAVKAVS